jgi:NIPSNAP
MSPKCNFKISALLLHPPVSSLAAVIPIARVIVLALNSGFGLMRGSCAFVGLVAMLLLAACSLVRGETVRPPYYELRIYTVTSNKLDAVLERFRETVEPVRRRHGIKTVGYWSLAATNAEKFIYLLTAPSAQELQRQESEFAADPDFQKGFGASNAKHGKTVDRISTLPLQVDPTTKFNFAPSNSARVFNLRIYSVLPGKLDAFRNRWRDFAVPIYERHGLHSVGWWVADQKDAEGNDQFVCLLAGASIPAILKSIEAFHKDDEWIRVEKETESAGKLRSRLTAYTMTPTEFSNLK